MSFIAPHLHVLLLLVFAAAAAWNSTHLLLLLQLRLIHEQVEVLQ